MKFPAIIIILLFCAPELHAQRGLIPTRAEDSVFHQLYLEPEVQQSNEVYKRWSKGKDSLTFRIEHRPESPVGFYLLYGGLRGEDGKFFAVLQNSYRYDPLTNTFFILDTGTWTYVTFRELRVRAAKRAKGPGLLERVVSIFGTRCG